MNAAYDFLIAPFADFAFMRRALIGCLALALGSGVVGVFLVLRRMSLIGDTMAHSVLPGAAVGFIIGGLSLPAMGLGGFIAGVLVAALSGLITRHTGLKEDASFASFFIIALAGGVLLISLNGSPVDLMHVLFGSILAVDDISLLLMAGVSSISMISFAVLYRGLTAECFDSTFMLAVGRHGGLIHIAFLALVVLNMVSGFLALGTLMAVGLMMLPATAARFWTGEIGAMIPISTIVAFASAYLGLTLSFAFNLPSGPTIVLTAGGFYLFSVAMGPKDGLLWRFIKRRHLKG